MLVAALHAYLFEVEVGGFVWGEEDVVVGGVFMFFEHGGDDVTAEMVIAARGEVASAEDFFVLDVCVGNGQDLGAEAEFAESSRHGVVGEASVVGIDGGLIAFDEGGFENVAVLHVEDAESSVFVLHRELSTSVGGDEIDFASGEVGDVGSFSLAEAVRFLGFLGVETEPSGEDASVFELEIDFDFIGFGECEAEAFGVGGDFVVIDGES